MKLTTNSQANGKRSWWKGLQNFAEALEYEEIDDVWAHLKALKSQVNELESRLRELEGTSSISDPIRVVNKA